MREVKGRHEVLHVLNGIRYGKNIDPKTKEALQSLIQRAIYADAKVSDSFVGISLYFGESKDDYSTCVEWNSDTGFIGRPSSLILQLIEIMEMKACPSILKDVYKRCAHCVKMTLHRFKPSPDAGPYWRCSECGEINA